jgi:dTDP-4-dehydrorhamnose 3,5-epimerase
LLFTATPIDAAWVIDLEPREDARGFFARAWCREEFDARGLATGFAQANLSRTRQAGTIRGLHHQVAPHSEAKLVRCIRGAIFDVIVDLRPTSGSYMRWYGVELTADNHRQLYAPEGCAHGYQVLEDETEVFYQASTFYAPEAERGIRWNDPAFHIEWPLADADVSDKDRAWPNFVAEPAAVLPGQTGRGRQ